jgi:hypothetical protein
MHPEIHMLQGIIEDQTNQCTQTYLSLNIHPLDLQLF